MMLEKLLQYNHLMVYGNYRRGSLLVNLIGRALKMKRKKITHKSLLYSVFASLSILLLIVIELCYNFCSHICTFDE